MRMKALQAFFFVLLILLNSNWNVALAGGASSAKNNAAKMEKIPGSDLAQITLTPKAHDRLGIETTQVVEKSQSDTFRNTSSTNPPNTMPIAGQQVPMSGGQTNSQQPLSANTTGQKIIPYSALLYEIDGTTWVYISPKPLVYLRHKVVVDHIDGNVVFLREGPSLGTQVVTIGVDELYGVEKGIAK